MATGTIKQFAVKNITTASGNGSGTVTSPGGFANIDLTFSPPENGTLLIEAVDSVGASSSANDINTLVKIDSTSTTSRYRVVSASAQTITLRASRLYRINF